MARKSQKLINYHGTTEFGSSQLSELKIGEIAVKHSADGNAQLIIKTGSNDESASQAIFIESAAVANMITQALTGTYATIEYVNGASANAYTEAVTDANGYTDTVSGYIATALYAHTGDSTIHLTTDDVKTQIEEYNYATIEYANAGSGNAYNNAVTYANTASSKAYTDATAYTDTVSGYIANYVYDTLSTVYTYKGSKATYGELPSTDNKTGDVWNVVAAHGDTPAGTNYAWTGSGWDALGGTIDLSTYATKEYVNGEIDALSATYATTGTVQGINDTLTAHTANTIIHVTAEDKTTWSGKQDAITDLAEIRTNAASGYAAYTTVTAHTADTTIHVTTTDKTTWNDAATAITQHIGDTNVHVTTADKTKWNEALQGFELTGTGASSTGTQSTQCGVIANYTTGGTATLDLSAIVIDCGEW